MIGGREEEEKDVINESVVCFSSLMFFLGFFGVLSFEFRLILNHVRNLEPKNPYLLQLLKNTDV